MHLSWGVWKWLWRLWLRWASCSFLDTLRQLLSERCWGSFQPWLVDVVIWMLAHSDPSGNGTAQTEPFFCVSMGHCAVRVTPKGSSVWAGQNCMGSAHVCLWKWDRTSWQGYVWLDLSASRNPDLDHDPVCPGGGLSTVTPQGLQLKENSLEVSANKLLRWSLPNCLHLFRTTTSELTVLTSALPVAKQLCSGSQLCAGAAVWAWACV